MMLIFISLCLFSLLLTQLHHASAFESTSTVSHQPNHELSFTPSDSVTGSHGINSSTVLAASTTSSDTLVRCEKLYLQSDACAFVHANCNDIPHLINYLSIVYCSPHLPIIVSYVVLLVLVMCVIRLLATTASVFFVPTLTQLSDFLKLSPSVSGLTLLAFGKSVAFIKIEQLSCN